ncbi:7-cyano-7-deazaguanine synthase [Clostridium saccharoperbutylacetonicum]|uniref:7-cyano-7-deazaguanine synthase n=1 Tax=Clostridium saccharoperbutylacetonicum TaxID=36745 RepID=UPI000983D1E3|nr:7-cyano-7-deazaguanine synthase [Clostridium saccharoperbutylacetonicum]AQR95586.1 7-cyano-7-deazaguanine synthase [Clostridium saccharoperbutylacetonicum]NSB31446.1 7-cyano-7-deazaguanine synthase in queuosine biosynthesis [Clostridium saccharoperbutylacetonicum]
MNNSRQNTSNELLIGDSFLPSQILLNGKGLENIGDEIFLDFIDVAAKIFIEDVSNKVNSKDEPRNIDVIVPVTNAQIWTSQKKLLERIGNFLSGDRWNIEFTNCNSKLPKFYIKSFITTPAFDNVTLLSGGLDSFCGSYVNVENKVQSIYCGYKINKFETKGLNEIHNIIKEYKGVSKRFNTLNITKEEHTQRTRSFLFFALACATASMYNINEILLYENGVLSLNPELDSRKTTKTTHPKTLYLVNQLLTNLNLNMRIRHPFLFKTKGQMINELSDEFKNNIKFTNTCGKARNNRKIKIKSGHCGFCIPCMLRKISMAAYGNEKYDLEYNAPYGTNLENCDIAFKSEFKSSNEYFRVFNEKIKDGTIFNELDIRSKYYNEKNYLELTKKMLDMFGKEVDTFYSKYPL